MSEGRRANRYSRLLEHIFFAHYIEGAREVPFERAELETAATTLGIKLPKNLGDVMYSFRYRSALPRTIIDTAPEGEHWLIRPAGSGKYRFEATAQAPLAPNPSYVETKVPDATPGLIAKYALTDEQALLARLRYNRLIDVFLGLTCYSLQNHLRTQVPGMGQVETDEIYVGLDRRGVHYVIPVQAKGGRDQLSFVQIEQDLAMCAHKFPGLICLPVAAQFMAGDVIALFTFEAGAEGVAISAERHYRLVLPDDITEAEIQRYQQRPDN